MLWASLACGDSGLVTKLSLTLATPWTVAHPAPLSLAFPRREYWSGLSCPSPGDLPDPGIEPTSPALAGRCLTAEPPEKPRSLASEVSSNFESVQVTFSGVRFDGTSVPRETTRFSRNGPGLGSGHLLLTPDHLVT